MASFDGVRRDLTPPTVAEVEMEYRYIMRRLFGPHPGADLWDTNQKFRDVRVYLPTRAWAAFQPS